MRSPCRLVHVRLIPLALAALFVGCSTPSRPNPWRVAQATGTAQGYRDFLASEPASQFAEEARTRLEALDWARVEETSAREDFELYLRDHPGGPHALEAADAIEDLHRRAAFESGDPRALRAYAEAYPVGIDVPKALRRAAEIELAVSEGQRLTALEAEAAVALEQVAADAPLAKWEELFERFYESSARARIGAQLQALAPADARATLDEVRAGADVVRANIKAEGVTARLVIAAQVLVDDEIAGGVDPVALLLKRPDHSFVSVSDHGQWPSFIASREPLLRSAEPGEIALLQISREALYGSEEALNQDVVNSWSSLCRLNEWDFYTTRLWTAPPADDIVPDETAPGSLSVPEVNMRMFYLGRAFDEHGLAGELPFIPLDSRSWALDRLASAGWAPRDAHAQAVHAIVANDLGALGTLGDGARTAALQIYVEGAEDLRERAAEALRSLDPEGAERALAWATAQNEQSVALFDSFCETWPDAPEARVARETAARLRSDESLYREMLAEEYVRQAALQFLKRYPGHVREDDVRRFLDGVDAFELLDAGLLEMRAVGAGIQKMEVRVRTRVPEPVTVKFDVGTLFEPADAATQTMVTTRSTVQIIRPHQWTSLKISVACAARPKNVPGGKDIFTVRRLPAADDLRRALEIAKEEDVPFEVEQAVTWILTDDASFKDLQVLRGVSRNPLGRRDWSLIKEKEAAQALWILQRAGVDVGSTRLMEDRVEITAGLDPGELRDWLTGVM